MSLTNSDGSPVPPLTPLAWQAQGAWQGGTVVGVALDARSNGTRGLLASRAGLYGWREAGAALVPLVQGMSDLNVVAVTFAGGDNAQAATALAATATGRIFLRAADAAHETPWQEVASWAGLGVGVALAPSPAFATDGTLFVGTPAGIFRTFDRGATWESCNFGLLDEDVLCMACAPNFAESEMLWAGTAGGGLYRSRNRARAWRESGNGLPDAAVQSLALSPNFAVDQTLYAGMEEYGIYVSRDGGENWTRFALANQSVNTLACPQADWLWAGTEDGLWRVTVASGEAVQVVSAGEVVLSVAATATGAVAIGLFGSGLCLTQHGGGAPDQIVWQRPGLALHAPPVVAHVGDAIFALDSDGFMAQRTDNRVQWLEMASASPDSVFALDGAQVEQSGDGGEVALFAATGTGLARWTSGQGAWQEVARAPFHDQTALGIDVSPTFADDQTLLVTAHNSALLVSQDAGATWQTITGPWQGQNLLHAHFAPRRASELVALTVQPNETGHFAMAVWHSVDLGQKWEGLAQLSSGVPAALLAWPEDAVEEPIFLATQHRVIKLYNQSDPPELQVHQHFFDEHVRVTALATAPDYADNTIIWAATTAGLYRSVDRGMSWGLMAPLPDALPVVWLDITFTHLNAITLGGRVWRAAL